MARPVDAPAVTDYVHPHSINALTPMGAIMPPKISGEYSVDEAVLEAFPVPGTKLEAAYRYGSSMWAHTAKVTTTLPDGSKCDYFLKVIPNEYPGRHMCEGEFESLRAIRAVSPTFVPKPYAWGALRNGVGYYFLAEFRDVGQQPADSQKLALRLAELHQNSESPTGKFGFHVVTCHGNLPQDCLGWESSWTKMFTRILGRAFDLDDLKNPPWPKYNAVRRLFFDKVIPRLLDPLQSEGRSIKPCLVHGDVWDENCADDMNTGEPFAFDAGSFYAHNEYEIGFWRPPRFRLSNKRYVRAYKKNFPMSEPEGDWDNRNLLYSIRLNISCSTLIPSSGQKLVVFEDMKTLCRDLFPQEMKEITAKFSSPVMGEDQDFDEEEEEELDDDEEEEEEEEEEKEKDH